MLKVLVSSLFVLALTNVQLAAQGTDQEHARLLGMGMTLIDVTQSDSGLLRGVLHYTYTYPNDDTTRLHQGIIILVSVRDGRVCDEKVGLVKMPFTLGLDSFVKEHGLPDRAYDQSPDESSDKRAFWKAGWYLVEHDNVLWEGRHWRGCDAQHR